MKILLAEDDHNISTIAELALAQLGGHEVTIAENGEKALTLALSQDWDVILLDEMMPKMNGLLVCQEYLKQCQNPSPIIFLSAKSQKSDVAEFNKWGLGHIPKPFEPPLLSQQIEDILNQGKTEAA